uniref:Uncharacterized protein n=1 Tax=viral metagenome TaxID=1070528 RepID=A0A6C0BNN1_9ZZZZ
MCGSPHGLHPYGPNSRQYHSLWNTVRIIIQPSSNSSNLPGSQLSSLQCNLSSNLNNQLIRTSPMYIAYILRHSDQIESPHRQHPQ